MVSHDDQLKLVVGLPIEFGCLLDGRNVNLSHQLSLMNDQLISAMFLWQLCCNMLGLKGTSIAKNLEIHSFIFDSLSADWFVYEAVCIRSVCVLVRYSFVSSISLRFYLKLLLLFLLLLNWVVRSFKCIHQKFLTVNFLDKRLISFVINFNRC